MPDDWYVSRQGDEKRFGPYSDDKLKQLAEDGRLQSNDLVWRDGMADWVEAIDLGGLQFDLPAPPSPATHVTRQPAPANNGNRIAAGICGILLGPLGVHKFIYGATVPGIIMLLVSVLTCGWGALPMYVIGVIEGIIYLTKSDEEFEDIYTIGKRGWF